MTSHPHAADIPAAPQTSNRGGPADRTGWEHQALDSIKSALGHADPKLASLLATFSRLASGDEMPAHEKVRSPLHHPPRRRRSRPRRGKAHTAIAVCGEP